MPKPKTTDDDVAGLNTIQPSTMTGQNVSFTPEQMGFINEMIARNSKQQRSPNEAYSVYGQRDPQSIDTVNVKRFDGKFVIGFKNLQNDIYKKHIPKYVENDFDPISQLRSQPFITLILSDGVEEVEKKVRLLDYYDNRDRFDAKVLKIERKTVIEDHGTLGSSSLAVEIGADGKPVTRPSLKQETKHEVMVFHVELPGFDEPVLFNNDPIGPLA